MRFYTSPIVIRNLNTDVNISGPFLADNGIDQLHSKGALKVKGKLVRLFTYKAAVQNGATAANGTITTLSLTQAVAVVEKHPVVTTPDDSLVVVRKHPTVTSLPGHQTLSKGKNSQSDSTIPHLESSLKSSNVYVARTTRTQPTRPSSSQSTSRR